MWLPGRVEIGLSVHSWVEGLFADKSLSMEHQKKNPQKEKDIPAQVKDDDVQLICK